MRIGLKTRIWGIQLNDIEGVCTTISKYGFQGVEFSQRPELIGVRNSDDLSQILRDNDLELLSLSCGTVLERINFLGKNLSQYMYVKHSDIAQIDRVTKLGYVPVFHPGVFNPVRKQADISKLMRAQPKLRLALDTSHIQITGEDPIDVIDELYEHISVIHLKDWTPKHGHTGSRYSRGFVEFGKGIVPLSDVIDLLRTQGFDGWVILEVEKPYKNVLNTVYTLAKWLFEHKLLTRPAQLRNHSVLSDLPSITVDRTCNAEVEVRFREIIALSTTGSIARFYESVHLAYSNLFPNSIIEILMCSPSQDKLRALVITAIPQSDNYQYLRETTKTLSGVTIDRQSPVTIFDLFDDCPAKKYGDSRSFSKHIVLDERNRYLISLPLFNLNNQNYCRMVVNIYSDNSTLPATIMELHRFAQSVIIAADTVLDRFCSAAATNVNMLAGRADTSTDFLKNLITLIQDTLNCMGVSVFIVNESEDKLELTSTTGLSWFVKEDEQFYTKGEGLTGKTWEDSSPFVTVNSLEEEFHKGKSTENVISSMHHSCLFMPIKNIKGQVLGVVRCRNKRQVRQIPVPTIFLEDDIAILNAILQSSVSHIQILLEKERRVRALGRLTHELKHPVTIIRAAAESMMKTQGVNNLFDYDYPSDVWSWSELMRRLLNNSDYYQFAATNLLETSPTLLKGDVIAPAVKQVRALLNEYGFSVGNITYGDFRSIPRLYIDRNQFQQVLFNLLSNSIKHSYEDPTAFQVEITGYYDGDSYIIQFEDWGPGIDSHFRQKIFSEYYRTPDARSRAITGQGLGLWVVKQIISAHDAQVVLTRTRLPTQFSIIFPRYLAKSPPRTNTKEGR